MEIKTVFDFNKALANGPYAWPGGYPLYFITADGAALDFQAATDESALIRDAIIDDDKLSGWRIVATAINYEDARLYCDHSGRKIECAYEA